ncbi:Y+L amino acid transporter 2 [Chionoecetes opilio]|uniref:Y+L amino acid transporter 2 n=1 Tax=Chionoecetes opilio TaxID=41210 RepID=A0A8J4XX18_CHIOP|nr:Y+L amino acid transporter 2 [Chionoecetes opilio]
MRRDCACSCAVCLESWMGREICQGVHIPKFWEQQPIIRRRKFSRQRQETDEKAHDGRKVGEEQRRQRMTDEPGRSKEKEIKRSFTKRDRRKRKASTGIFESPRAVLQDSGGSVGMSLIVWVLSGVMCIVGAFCYVELGTMIPKSGGTYTYLYEAYGSFPAFIYLFYMVTISIPGGRAVSALTFANYVLQPFFPDGQPPPDSALRLIGIELTVTLTYVNCKKVRWATRVQDLLALTKVFALIVIIVVGVCHLFRGTTQNFEDPMEGTTTHPALLATTFYHTIYAYDGCSFLSV